MKKIIILIALFLAVYFIVPEKVSATHQYFRNINTSTGTRWNVAANWSLTSGGGATGAVPIVSDTVYIDANSNDTVLIYAAATCKTLIVTQANNMFFGSGAASFNLTVAGSITFPAGMNFTPSGGLTNYAGQLIASASGTETSNGNTFPNTFKITGNAQTFELADDWTVGTFVNGTTTGTSILNSNTLYCTNLDGAFTSATALTGSVAIVVSGTWSHTTTTVPLKIASLTLLTGATISGAVYFGSPTAGATTLTVAAGAAITVTSSTLQVMSGSTGATTTLDLNGLTLNNFTIKPQTTVIGSTITLASGLVVTGALTDGVCLTHNAVVSSLPGTKRAITLMPGGTMDLMADFTDVDASAGQTIWSFRSTITTCTNVRVLTAQVTRSHSF